MIQQSVGSFRRLSETTKIVGRSTTEFHGHVCGTPRLYGCSLTGEFRRAFENCFAYAYCFGAVRDSGPRSSVEFGLLPAIRGIELSSVNQCDNLRHQRVVDRVGCNRGLV